MARMNGLLLWVGLGLLLAAGGCRPKAEPSKDREDEKHSHGKGPNGGAVTHLGKYHVEFTVDHPKQEATVRVYKANLKTPAPLAVDKLHLKIKEPPFELDLLPVPRSKDPKGRSSRFAGKHEKLGKVQEFAGTISATIDGKQLSGDFEEEPEEKGKGQP